MKHPPSLLRSFWDIFKKKEFFAKKFFWVWIKLCKSEGQTFQCSDIVFNIYIYIFFVEFFSRKRQKCANTSKLWIFRLTACLYYGNISFHLVDF